MSDLLPCPFCGGKARLGHDDSSDYSKDWNYIVTCTKWGLGRNENDKCGIEGASRKTKDEAIQAWNTRAENAVIQQLAEALQRFNPLTDRCNEDYAVRKQALALAEPYLQKKEGK